MSKAKRAVGTGGAAWSAEEQRLLWALRAAGLSVSLVTKALNRHYQRRGDAVRSLSAVNKAFTKFKTMKGQITQEDEMLAHNLVRGDRNAPSAESVEQAPPPKRKYVHKNMLVTPPSGPHTTALSPAAQKTLEAKLALTATIRRFKLETPEASIEVAVSGRGADVIFKKIVNAITVFGK